MTLPKEMVQRHQKGISLLEILLAVAIMAVIAVYSMRIVHSVDAGAKTDQCQVRMKDIALQMKNYYRSQQALPEPEDNPPDSVPVQQLNLSQKHRLDTWGHYLFYFVAIKSDGYSGQAITNIVGYQVDGRTAAGVLISLGPNQTQDYKYTSNPPKFTTEKGDDLLMPITLEEEAWQNVMAELEALDKRVSAYDRVFAGIDNGGTNIYEDTGSVDLEPQCYPYPLPNLNSYELVDEDGCDAARGGGGGVGCLPTGSGMVNDPNCGRATIDACPTALNDILQLYGLGGAYRTDPWGNEYQWGNSAIFESSDRRYHLFYSMGPDGQSGPYDTNGADDILGTADDEVDDDITPY